MTSIAVLGSGGQVAPSIIESLTSSVFADKISYPIKVITRQDIPSTDKIQYIKSDLGEGLIKDLQGTDVVISTLPPNPEILSKVEQVIETVKPKIYIPSEYGNENDKVDAKLLVDTLAPKVNHNKALIAKGIKVVVVNTSFFRIPPIFLYGFTNHIGIDQENATVKVVGDLDTKVVDFSTAKDIGNSVAAIATTDPSKVLDKYRIRSGRVKLSQIIEGLEKEQGKKYQIKSVTIDDEIDILNKDRSNFPQALFVYYSLGEDQGVIYKSDEDEVINPHESLWKWQGW